MPRKVNDEELVKSALRKRLKLSSGDKAPIADLLAITRELLRPSKAQMIARLEHLEKEIEDLKATTSSLTTFIQSKKPKQVGEFKFGSLQ